MAFAPIWKDRIVTLSPSAAYVDYTIHQGSGSGPVIFSGRAYARPDASAVTTRINDICAAYLAATLPNLGSRFTPMQVSETFVTKAGGTTKDTITFVNDWSYDPSRVLSASHPLSDPINGELDPRQWLVFSVLSGASSVNVTLHFTDGSSSVVAVPVAMSADFNDDFNGDFVQSDDPSKSGTAVLDLSAFSDLASVTFLGVTLQVRAEACARYAAFYVNAYGGWDSFLLDGYDTQQDQLTRHTIQVEADNTDLSGRGLKDYAVEVSPEWTLRTGLLTDDESGRMHHLLNSAEVYLCDLSTGQFLPVVLTDATAPKQTFKGNGRRPVSYTFTAKLAQERFRL